MLQDPEALHKVERHLREVLDPTGDYEEVADFLATLREGGAQIVYPCGTHENPVECEVENFVEILGGLSKSEGDVSRTELRKYLVEHGHHRECHS